MKTMKLLPLKIAVTSAMIIGLGAASTANAQQAQSGQNTTKTSLELARGEIDYHYNNFDKLKNLDRFKSVTFTNQQLHVAAMEELSENIDDLYEANEENVERIVTIDHAAAANRQNIQNLAKAQLAGVTVMEELDKKSDENAQKIENLRTLFETRGRTVKNNEKSVKENKESIAKNKANIQNLAKAQLAGVEVMTELNKNVEANKADIAKNNASIEDLYEYGQEVANSIGEIHDHNRQQNETLENLITNSTNNTDNIAKNKANIQNLAKAQLAGVGAMEELNKNVEENKADIAANKADADAKFVGVQTDIANNKTTLAEHAKKINDNQQAIEAKLGGKADLQKLAELKTSVDKNQAGIQLHDQKINNLGILHTMVARAVGANKDRIDQNKADIAENKEDIQNNINNIYELAQQQDQHSSDIKTLAKASSANTDNIVKNKAKIQDLAKAQLAGVEVMTELNKNVEKNKADADASFKTLTKNQNALIEKDKAQDTLITANKADADAKFKGVQTDIANNKTTLAQHAKKIDDNQKAIETKLNGKADTQVLTDLNNKVDGFDGRISALDTKVNAFDGRITALDSKVENGMAAQAALSGLFQPYSVGKFNATAALGGYGSKSAVAIGAGYRVNPNLAIKAGAAINTSGDKKGSYNIGVNYEF